MIGRERLQRSRCRWFFFSSLLSSFWLFVGTIHATTCDIYEAGHTPCVAAHSVIRALYQNYRGPLYALRRSSDNRTIDVGVEKTGGFANVSAHETFCANTSCVFLTIYDQSNHGNHLSQGPPGGAHWKKDLLANAAAGPIEIGGRTFYGLRMDPPSGYRNDNTTGIATGDEAETIYFVVNGTHFNDRVRGPSSLS